MFERNILDRHGQFQGRHAPKQCVEHDLQFDAGELLADALVPAVAERDVLARAELQIVFHTLLRRVPTLELAVPIAGVPLKHDRLAYGVYELPVTW